MAKRSPKIFRLMVRDAYFRPGPDRREAAKKFGSGPFFRVFRSFRGSVITGNGKRGCGLETVIDRCKEAGLKPLFYIDETVDEEGQLKCAEECVALAIKHRLAAIGIFSPVSEFLDDVRKMDAGRLKVRVGRLAGHAKDWRQEIEREAKKGTNVIVFYAYEHGDQEIKRMVRFADKRGIAIMFNIRDTQTLEQDRLEFAGPILKLTAKGGGGIICNDPEAARLTFKKR